MTYAVLLGVLAVQALVLEGWHRALDVPGRRGSWLIGGPTAVACALLVLGDDGTAPYAPVPPVLGLAMIAAVVHQMVRRDGRDQLNASLAATVTVLVLAAAAPGYLAALDLDQGPNIVLTVATAAALCALVPVFGDRAGLPGWVQVLLGPLMALPVGAVAGLIGPQATADAVLLAVAAAGAATAGGTLGGRAPRPARPVAVGLSFATAAPVAYILGKVLTG